MEYLGLIKVGGALMNRVLLERELDSPSQDYEMYLTWLGIL